MCEVLAGFEDEAFEFGNAVGIGGFLFESLEDDSHVFIKVGHAQSLQVPICGCTPSQTLERCGSFLELSGGEHDLILLVLTL